MGRRGGENLLLAYGSWVFALALNSVGVQLPACAAEPAGPKYGWREVWAGGDAMRGVWLLYSGVTLAPFNEHVYEPGWRLRIQSGYGQYDYMLQDSDGSAATFRGSVTFTDALVGYHWHQGSLTAKIFGGLAVISHDARPTASFGHLVGLKWGPKVAAELWLDIGDTQWTSLNISYTTAHNTASLRWRYGLKVFEGLALGPEIRFDTNAGLHEDFGDMFAEYEGRAGLFASYAWGNYEISGGAGVASYVKGFEADQVTPYATVNFLMNY